MYLVVENNGERKFYPVLKEYKDGTFDTVFGRIKVTLDKTVYVRTKKFKWMPIFAEIKE